jgi:hypothetical protein
MDENSKQTASGGTTNLDWWPNQLNLDILRQASEDGTAGLVCLYLPTCDSELETTLGLLPPHRPPGY